MIGVLLTPTAAIILWISIFGSTALYIELFGQGGITEAVNQNIATALFSLLERFPLHLLIQTSYSTCAQQGKAEVCITNFETTLKTLCWQDLDIAYRLNI